MEEKNLTEIQATKLFIKKIDVILGKYFSISVIKAATFFQIY